LHETLLKLATGYEYEYEEREIVAGRNGSPERVKVIKQHKLPETSRQFKKSRPCANWVYRKKVTPALVRPMQVFLFCMKRKAYWSLFSHFGFLFKMTGALKFLRLKTPGWNH